MNKNYSEFKNLSSFSTLHKLSVFYISGNYRSSVKDCIIARKFKPDHMKAIVRGIYCLLNVADCCIKYSSAAFSCSRNMNDKMLPNVCTNRKPVLSCAKQSGGLHSMV